MAQAGGVLSLALFPAWVIGQVCRDEWWITGLLFYIPSPVLFLCLVITALLNGRQRHWRRSAVCAVLSLVPLYFVAVVENTSGGRSTQEHPAPLRAVHWNVCSGHLGIAQITETLLSFDADLYVLSEAPYPFPEIDGYSSQRVGTMQLLSRFPMESPGSLNPRSGRCYSMRWKTPDAELLVMVADLPSSIGYHRHPMLCELTQQLSGTRADLLLGDLNAPRRSLALSALPDGYQHAYDSAGSGWSYTWPSFFPVFAIDHCIHGEDVTPIRYQLQTAPYSDHRIQVFDFAVDESATAGQR